ncbi:muraminidase [Erwinia sp. OLTSP20]|uniref:lysozyme n=1 Tax=unclassified Erwinia TaxID=2622719 RepID=UPI000C19C743|nr:MULTISPECIES: lysozyme [unclassified Erwinia]PIJ50928.1 muraminidase [Erwinia sp. OAMSP11]PIJ75944.1 muraminidase [Erwinia sp. OLSSP12]PIJ83610.1 muraminidase [Erwinia sp. OLCASP19]PIJ87465.1 muraminidase [Erwinia sp. OLMTSP26]PIJ89014.1 muraminidase [Erwinia sp. OLMDSP33]
MEISKNGIDLIKTFEGCSLVAYQDAVGVWTIGYGWTNPVDGVPIHAGMTITQQKADELLKEGVKQYEAPVNQNVTVRLKQFQFDALVSFTYNLGAANFISSTLLKKLNAGEVQEAADEFLRWNKAGGKVLFGLLRRRAYERDLFLGYTAS